LFDKPFISEKKQHIKEGKQIGIVFLIHYEKNKGAARVIGQRIRKFLYTLNVKQALLIVFVLSLPWLLFLIKRLFEFNYGLAKTLGNTALVYFAIAFMLYPFLLSISRMGKRSIRKKLVTFTRIYIRFHVATAIFGTVFIIFHAGWMVSNNPLGSLHGITGIVAVLALFGVLITGYLRKQKSSGKRRRYHRYSSFLFIAAVLIHLLV
jgi:small-conductance mechanosensitive channel